MKQHNPDLGPAWGGKWMALEIIQSMWRGKEEDKKIYQFDKNENKDYSLISASTINFFLTRIIHQQVSYELCIYLFYTVKS